MFPEWYKRAACKGETESFFSYDEEKEAHALAICKDCPVRQECLETALADRNLFGVWGGTTRAERRRFHRRAVTARHAYRPRTPGRAPSESIQFRVRYRNKRWSIVGFSAKVGSCDVAFHRGSSAGMSRPNVAQPRE